MTNEELEKAKKKAQTKFERTKDVNVLREYLEQVTGHEVSLAQLTPSQKQALIKIMAIDRMFLSPYIDKDAESDRVNACKEIVKIVVEISRSGGEGLESFQNVLNAKARIDQDVGTLESESERNEGGSEGDS